MKQERKCLHTFELSRTELTPTLSGGCVAEGMCMAWHGHSKVTAQQAQEVAQN